MELIIDTNKVLAGTIRSGKVRKIIVFSDINFYSPRFLIDELDKHKVDISTKAKLSVEEFYYIFEKLILPEIELIGEDVYGNKIEEGFEVARQFDENDTPFIALTLKSNMPIWTNDKYMIEFGLKSQEYLALDTEAVEMSLQGKSLEEITENLKEKYLSR